nr:HNH endonuclease [Paracoccus sp. pheM1]
MCSCGAIVPHGVLCACQQARQLERKRRYDRTRPTASQRGYNGEWRKLRAEFLRLHPTCAFCGADAEHVDHKVRHRGNKALLLNWNNLQSLCAHCHVSTKQRMERAADNAACEKC